MTSPLHISEYHFYSFLHDAEVVRVSVWDAHGDEYWAIVPDGRDYAEKRAIAVDALVEAIEDEDKFPGEHLPFGCLLDQTNFNTQHLRNRRSSP